MSKELKTLVPSVVLKFVDGLLKRYEGKTDYNIYITKDWLLEIKQCLERLESIDNSNPSEALECLENLCDEFPILKKDYKIIKQALLKAQEPKQYLKWEDLDKFEEQKDFFGLLNGNKYTLWWYRDSRNKYVMINLNEINIVTLCDMFKQDIDFFNDLHLERVEE